MVTKSEAFPSRFWKAADLPPAGIVVKIAKLELDKIGPNQEEKYVLYFKGQDKQLVVNSTNWDLIEAFCGADSDVWGGKDICLYPDKTPFQGKLTPCIRVRRPEQRVVQAKPVAKPALPKAPAKEQTPPPDEDGDPGPDPGDAIDEIV